MSFDGDGNARVSVPQRIDGNELGLSYTVYNRTSLTEGSWAELSTNAIFTSSIEGTAEYETYGYRFWVGTGSFSDRFFFAWKYLIISWMQITCGVRLLSVGPAPARPREI